MGLTTTLSKGIFRNMCCDHLGLLAQARTAELRDLADRRRLVADSKAGRIRPVRRRAGWWLVGLGLRLAVGRDARLSA